MNDALNKKPAATGDRPSPRFASFVRHGVVACVLACTAAGAMAGGQDRNPRRDDMQQQSMRDRYDSRAQDPRNDARAFDMQIREEASRRAMEEQARASAREERQRGRMSADERRDLRRQINEANVELYPNARRR
jgi:hypothetical protein